MFFHSLTITSRLQTDARPTYFHSRISIRGALRQGDPRGNPTRGAPTGASEKEHFFIHWHQLDF